MARIRSIKPDFWTDEKVVELSAFARLLFIGLWNFADDEGRMQYSPKKIKMQIFPADSLDISELFGEIRGASLIDIYVVDNIEYLEIKNFAKHQKIDKRTASKLPPSPSSAEFPRIPTTDGKGREGNGKEIPNSPQQAGDVIDISACPHQEIINLYAKHLPMGIQPKIWHEARQTALRARWREDVKRQRLEWWDDFFAYIAKSDFLTGKVSNREGRAFEVSLDWIVTASNFAKIIEGRYENKAAA
jgi:hypothetical protein